MATLRLALAQINPTVGDLGHNSDLIIHHIEKAEQEGIDIIAFPELAVTGYPPEDLLLKHDFIKDNMDAAERISRSAGEITAIFGFAERVEGKIYNSAAIASNHEIVASYQKIHLPNYGVFDEKRYFIEGSDAPVYDLGQVRFGVNICEDIWFSPGPSDTQSANGASLIININGSPFSLGKRSQREEVLIERAKSNGIFIAYINMVGGQDELVFDGGSLIVDPKGHILMRANQFEENTYIYEIDLPTYKPSITSESINGLTQVTLPGSIKEGSPNVSSIPLSIMDQKEEIYRALVLGTRDYVRKCGFSKALIALSGGIDSSLVAAIAVEALGSENVKGVSLPSKFSSMGSKVDAKQLADNLEIRMDTIQIEEILQSMEKGLNDQFQGTQWGVAEENLQSRIRGNIMMALSNKFGFLVLTTGNKSEMAVGYATIYGDMAGGFSVIKDLPKGMVYEICHYINMKHGYDLIPNSVLIKPPSAELKPDQKDSDTLPDYDILDAILEKYIEQDLGIDEILNIGFDPGTVAEILNLVDMNEYKRRQSAPGIKITSKNFGRDRRMPISNKYRPY
ncbi:MAG: NAD+ synthase [Chloroflexota bacterium]|uniref:NAD(+) synthase (glutamine-hydrolyzing) n=1 Tax=marine metagenome TaxID=408172 RepID=A0A381WWQ0_9ZZZZ|nr:NAD+ synthase [Chloroflexota bacterium]HAT21534.1 NAD+ synthase [Dehalococcoidia bacterium]